LVEENFKLGLAIEFDIDKQLDALSKKIQKAVESAIEKGSKSAGKKAAPGAGAGVAAAVQSASAASSVSSADFKKGVSKAMSSQLSGFGDDVKRFADAINRLERVLERFKEAGAAGGSKEEKRMASRARSLPAIQERMATQQAKLQTLPADSPEAKKAADSLRKLEQAWSKIKTANLESSRKLEDSQDRLAQAMDKEAAAREEAARKVRASAPEGGVRVSGPKKEVVAEKQQGPSNIRKGANIDATRAGGSQRTAGGGGAGKAAILSDAPRVRDGRVGGPEDKPE